MEIDEWVIGQRIASHRVRRGLTQEELAGLVGISLSLMKKIEAGTRIVTKFSQLVLFAQALRIADLRDLTGVPLPLMPDGHRGHRRVEDVRAAVLRRGHGVELPDLRALRARVTQAWDTWQRPSAFRYDAVAQLLPDLIGQAHAAADNFRGNYRLRALTLASETYQLARTWSKRVGDYELSLLVADRAVSCALEAGDPDSVGAASWNLAMILSAQGETDQARSVVYHAIDDLAHQLNDSPKRLSVLGGLHLLGATEAARGNDANAAEALLAQAARIAGQIGETNHHRMAFGPTNVSLHRISTLIELGRTSEALSMAEETVVCDEMPVERRLTYYVDSARCYVLRRNAVAAVHMLDKVRRECSEELRYNVLARELLRQLNGTARASVRAELRPLLAAANLSD